MTSRESLSDPDGERALNVSGLTRDEINAAQIGELLLKGYATGLMVRESDSDVATACRERRTTHVETIHGKIRAMGGVASVAMVTPTRGFANDRGFLGVETRELTLFMVLLQGDDR